MDGLTKSDLEVLVEALDAWEIKDLGGQIVMSLLGSLIPDDPASKKAMEDQEKKTKTEASLRKERSSILKAKLYTIRSKMEIDEVTSP